MKMHIITLIYFGAILKAMESNVYEHAYRHTNTCWDNFIAVESNVYEHAYRHTNTFWDNFIS